MTGVFYMNFNNLDAVLYAEGLNEGEIGQAKISPYDRTCEFTGEFVPILRIDSPVIIVCKFQGFPLLQVTGKTYLASRHLLRVVDADCSLCEGAENLIETAVSIPAEIVKPTRRGEKLTPCTVSAIGTDAITLSDCSLNPDGADRELILRLDAPIFTYPTDLYLTASEKGLRFGDSPRIAYRYEELSAEDLRDIRTFIRLRENSKLAELFGR